MKNDSPGILRQIRVKRVSLVDMGANYDKKTGDGAHILLSKSAGLADVHVDRPLGSDDEEYETEYEKANLNAASRNSLPDSAFAAVWTGADGKKRRKLPIHDAGHLAAARGRIDEAQMPADVKAGARRKIEAATNRGGKMKKSWKGLFKSLVGAVSETDETKRAEGIAAIAKAADDLPDDNDEDDKKPMHKADDPMCKCDTCVSKRALPEDVLKSIAADFEKKLEGIRKENTELRGQVTAEIEKREIAEVEVELRKFKHVSIDLAKMAPEMLKLKKQFPAVYESQLGALKASDAALATSALFHDVGIRKGTGEGSAWAQIEAKAEQLMEKSANGNMTREQAIEKVCLQNPKLAAQYRAEANS